jgi:hypothetical protein
MTKGSKPCKVGEANKLVGIQNYNVWKKKMEAILRKERLWGLMKTNRSTVNFPAMVEGILYPSEEKFGSEKQRTRSGFILSITNNLLGVVSGKTNLADLWDLLRCMYNVGNQQQILFLTNKLHSMAMKEGGDMSTYFMEASNLQNHLVALWQDNFR